MVKVIFAQTRNGLEWFGEQVGFDGRSERSRLKKSPFVTFVQAGNCYFGRLFYAEDFSGRSGVAQVLVKLDLGLLHPEVNLAKPAGSLLTTVLDLTTEEALPALTEGLDAEIGQILASATEQLEADLQETLAVTQEPVNAPSLGFPDRALLPPVAKQLGAEGLAAVKLDSFAEHEAVLHALTQYLHNLVLGFQHDGNVFWYSGEAVDYAEMVQENDLPVLDFSTSGLVVSYLEHAEDADAWPEKKAELEAQLQTEELLNSEGTPRLALELLQVDRLTPVVVANGLSLQQLVKSAVTDYQVERSAIDVEVSQLMYSETVNSLLDNSESLAKLTYRANVPVQLKLVKLEATEQDESTESAESAADASASDSNLNATTNLTTKANQDSSAQAANTAHVATNAPNVPDKLKQVQFQANPTTSAQSKPAGVHLSYFSLILLVLVVWGLASLVFYLAVGL